MEIDMRKDLAVP